MAVVKGSRQQPDSGLTQAVEGMEEVVAPRETVVAKPGIMEFQQPWSHPTREGEYLLGYCLGDGTTLVIFYDGFHHDPPTMCRISDEDAVDIRNTHRNKQICLAWLERIKELYPIADAVADAVYYQDLFQSVKKLPMPVSRTLEPWKIEQDAMDAQAARDVARHERWKHGEGSELADIPKNPDRYNAA